MEEEERDNTKMGERLQKKADEAADAAEITRIMSLSKEDVRAERKEALNNNSNNEKS